MSSLTEHEAKSKGVHGIPNVNDLWNQYDFVGRWQALAGATGATAFGTVGVNAIGMAVPTVTGTLTNADDTNGQYVNLAPTAATINLAGTINSAFTLYRATWMPNFAARIKFGTDVTSQRVWVGLTSAALTASATPTAHIAAFRFDSAVDGGQLKAVTSAGVAATHTVSNTTAMVTANTAYTLGIEFEGVPGAAPKRIHFYVNRVLVATHTTNLPVSATTNLGITVGVTNLAASLRSVRLSRLSMAVQG